jgi:pSer/pThr/pTyr-binding forkhead associated (FHA) protein
VAEDCCETCGLYAGKSVEAMPRPDLSGPPSRFKVLVMSRRDVLEFLPTSTTFTFGRDPKNEAVLTDDALSRRQARLVFEDDGVYIEDLKSTCGTFVDGHKADRAKVGSGATISFGNTRVYVVER